MNLNACHASELKTLTGCSPALLALLETRLQVGMLNKRGPPYRHSLWTMLIVTLMKLRLQLSYRALSALTGIGYVTLSRIVLRMCALLASLPLAAPSGCGFPIVDSTGCRVRSRQRDDYSGYKHHHLRKLQVLCDDHKRIVCVSNAYPGSLHDLRIWNAEWVALRPTITSTVLGDKAYAGADGEGIVLQRPVKRNERLYRQHSCEARIWNGVINTLRVRIEHVFARIKSFAILANTFPLHRPRLGIVVRAIAVIYNCILEFKSAEAL